MALDVELYRRTLYLPAVPGSETLRRISVIDITPMNAPDSMSDPVPGGTAPTLVFIHGYGGDNLQWLPQLRFFGQSHRVIAPDLRGHGRSDDPREPAHSMDGLVGDLETVLAELRVEGPVTLLAHSFGGAIAVEYALRHPQSVEKLVLIAVPSRFVIHPLLRPVMSLPSALADPLARRLKLRLFAPIATLRRMYDGAMNPWRGADRLGRLRVPTLVIVGERDTVFSQQHYAAVPRLIPNAQQVTIPVSSHLVQLERPDAVNRAIRRFIEPKQRPGRDAVLEMMATVSAGGHAHNGHNGTTAGAGASGRSAASAASTSRRLAEMPWLQYYDTEVPHELPLSGLVLPDLLANAARDFPDRAALIFFGQRISYRELDRLSNRFAHALTSLGIRRGDRVAVLLPNVPQCVIAFYGALKVGAVAVMGSSLAGEGEVAMQLRDAGARAVVTLRGYRDVIQRAAAGSPVEQIILTDPREYLPLRRRLRLAGFASAALPVDARDTKGTTARGVSRGLERPAHKDRGPKGPAHSAEGLKPPDIAPPGPSGPRHRAPAIHGREGNAITTSAIHGREGRAIPESSFQWLLRAAARDVVPPAATASDLALLQYTSGTTDAPKGVMLSHANLVFNVIQNRHWMPEARRGRETILGVLPLSHSYGLTSCMNMALALGGSLVLLPTTRTKEILTAIKRHSPTIFPGVPAIYQAVANFPHVRRYGVASIRVCVSGSAPLPVEVQEAFEKLTRGRVVEGYGLTEASPVTHSNPLSGERRVGSIGIPLPSTLARVVDLQTGEPVAPDEVGELVVRGPQVMQGYWKRPDETAQALAGGWLRTGDLARMDEDGFFTIVDRKKDLILAGPYSVYPRDVEEVLYEHPKVFEAVAVAAHGSDGSPFVKAIVVLKRGEKATAEELLAFARERLEAYKVPRQIEFRRELPKNLVGKVLRRLLVEA